MSSPWHLNIITTDGIEHYTVTNDIRLIAFGGGGRGLSTRLDLGDANTFIEY